MNKKLKDVSLSMVIMITTIGCGGNSTSENNELRDARTLTKQIGKSKSSVNLTSVSDESSRSKLGFAVNGENGFSMPVAKDMLENNGIIKLTNKEGHQVVVELTDNNTATIKVDLNANGKFSKNEIVTDVYEPDTLPPVIKHDIYGDTLKEKMSNASENEKILLRVQLTESMGPDAYPDDQDNTKSTNSNNNPDSKANTNDKNNGTHFYERRPLTEEEKQKIQEEEQKMQLYRSSKNKELLKKFFTKNNIAYNDSIKNALNKGLLNFQISLTKQEIKDLVKTNKDWIVAITIPFSSDI